MTERMAMKLFDELVRPGARVHKPAERYTGPVQPELREQLLQAHRVWVDESLHSRVDFKPTVVDLATDFGELLLPFDYMWIEWFSVRNFGTANKDAVPLHIAMECLRLCSRTADGLLQEGEALTSDVGKYDWCVTPWLFNLADQVPVEIQNVVLVQFNDEGQFLGVSARECTSKGWVACPATDFQNVEEVLDPQGRRVGLVAVSTLIDMMWNGLVGLGFMNCKNVGLQRVERPVKQPRKARRQRPPKVDYHTIVLPRPKGAPSGNGSANKTGEIPLHHVRGHFKTYTPQAPLLGKHVGTYWWSHYVAGNPERGEVISDYRIKEPQ